ncbi:hypothetical protein ACLKA6_002733 [Drosophila palustris]
MCLTTIQSNGSYKFLKLIKMPSTDCMCRVEAAGDATTRDHKSDTWEIEGKLDQGGGKWMVSQLELPFTRNLARLKA